jgi:hypothetical protein
MVAALDTQIQLKWEPLLNLEVEKFERFRSVHLEIKSW